MLLRSSFLFLASVLTAGSILAGTASPALAASPAAETRIVTYADLDLASAAGRAVLDRRIATAVRAVCGRAAIQDLNALQQVALCRDEAEAGAYAQLRRGEVQVAIAR
jgi:UrcA family protein